MKTIKKIKCPKCGKTSKHSLPIDPDKTEYSVLVCPHCHTKHSVAININVEIIKKEE